MEKYKKLIVSDIDGTLLGTDSGISDFDRKMIEESKKQGAAFTISSGRAYMGFKFLTKELDIKVPVSSANGARIIDPLTDKAIYNAPLEKDTAKKIIRIFEDYPGFVYYYTKSEMYALELESAAKYYSDMNAILPQDQRMGVNIVDCLYDFPNEDIYKIVIKDSAKRGYEEIKERLEDIKGISHCTSWIDNIEVSSDNASKGKAALFIANHLGLDITKDVMVIGDEENDLSMFEMGAFSVAMGNGIDILKEKASFITADNDNGGVGKAIEEFLSR